MKLLSKEELEKEMIKNILDSLDLKNKPELQWTITYDKNSKKTYTRKDGLKLADISFFVTIIEPVDYHFTNSQPILYALQRLKTYLDDLEKKRKEDEKTRKLMDFFGLDIQKQRQDKLNKINENENT